MELVTCTKVLWILWACASVVAAFRVRGCTRGLLELVELDNTKNNIICDGLTEQDKFVWHISDVGDVASCANYGNNARKCTTEMDGYTAMRNNNFSSLTTSPGIRMLGNKIVQCKQNYGDREDSCKIRVVRRGTIKNQSVELRDTVLTGNVSFNNVFASDKKVFCRWNITRYGQVVDSVDTGPKLKEREFPSNTPLYGGQCNLHKDLRDLNISEGRHDVTVQLFPGSSPSEAGNFTITAPGPLTLDNDTCPEFVTEGDDLRCRCHHQTGREGSPPATVEWVNHSTTTQGVLELFGVKRDLDERNFTCRSSWISIEAGVKRQTYELNVVYGPDEATVTRSDEDDASQNVTLTCLAHDVKPKATFVWSVTCANKTNTPSSSICVLSQDDLNKAPTEIICQVSNSLSYSLRVAGTYTLLPMKNSVNDADKEPAPTGPPETAGMAVVIVAVVGVLVLFVTIIGVVICARKRRRRRKRKRRLAQQQQNQKLKTIRKPDQFEMIVNDVYESTDGCRTDGANTANTASPASRDRTNGEFEMIVNDVYESADGGLTDGTNTASPASRGRANGEFEMIVNDVYESTDGHRTDGTSTANTASPASRDRTNGDFVEIINDIYETSDGPDSGAQPPSRRPFPQQPTTTTTVTSEGDAYAVPEMKQPKHARKERNKMTRPTDQPPGIPGRHL